MKSLLSHCYICMYVHMYVLCTYIRSHSLAQAHNHLSTLTSQVLRLHMCTPIPGLLFHFFFNIDSIPVNISQKIS